MSEYQYYEFLAIERPLEQDEIDGLRALSTRAVITPVSFVNEYHWGGFKSDARKLLLRCFDAHVYVANWMTAVFMLRLPIEALSREIAEAFAVEDTLDIKADQNYWIIEWGLWDSENYDRFGVEDGRGWMARLAPIRDELLRGDIRSLYIGWLAAVNGEMFADDLMEPFSVSGMESLTAPQKALAKFIEADPDLLAGAGMGSPALQETQTFQKEMDAWLDAFPRDEAKAVLRQLLEGKGRRAEQSVRNRFAAWRRGLGDDRTDAPRRSVGELRKNAEKARHIRAEKQKCDRKRREVKRRREREAYLKNLSMDFPKAWNSIQKTVERGSGPAYDEACNDLSDLSDAYALCATRERFKEKMNDFMAAHRRRRALIQRLAKAGVWNE
ncbi:conserved hypothetical protein [Candidatus Desulfarcum epimagneticum]|uniref:Uncharacterized protein n=1 Tax=uncultured Desulfobacteraceae bacterium TaxID=218296 RepID=A0A484HK46_9BACT|nr:conserved hypothetical protein [uncultured Desulfobacteraceae bacterium]